MPDFGCGKIYKIVSDEEGVDEIYVGSTTRRRLCDRMSVHRHDARRGSTSKVYVYMREHGVATFRIVLVEDYPCESRKELNMREDHWRELLGATLNSNRAHNPERSRRTMVWRRANRERYLAYQRQYHARRRRLCSSAAPPSPARTPCAQPA